jgi:hypothetical protein
VRDHAGRRQLDETVTCLVRGPGSRYPRGYVWLIPAWFVIVAGAVIAVGRHASGRFPLWLGAAEVGGLAIAFGTLACVLGTVRRRAFRADKHGIWLGVRTTRRRPKLRQVHLAWPDIAQLRMQQSYYGVRLEISLGPSARIVHRPRLMTQALLLLGSLIMPVGFGRGRPALTMARSDPPRYLVKICDHSPADLKAALASVKPAEVPLRLLVKKGKSGVVGIPAPSIPPSPSAPRARLASSPRRAARAAPGATSACPGLHRSVTCWEDGSDGRDLLRLSLPRAGLRACAQAPPAR